MTIPFLPFSERQGPGPANYHSMIQLSAILNDYHGRVLLLPDVSTNSLRLPSTQLQAGILPSDTLASSIRETTGIIAMPIRLTGIYAQTTGLTLAFRVIQRGGVTITRKDGHPVAGFYEAIPVPRLMPIAEQQQLQDAMHHAGGSPICATAAASLADRLRRAFRSRNEESSDVKWAAVVNLIVQNSAGEVLWQREPDQALQHLPQASVPTGTLPCKAAAKLISHLTGETSDPVLIGIYVHPDQRRLELAYLVQLSALGGGDPWYIKPGDNTDIGEPGHLMQVTQAVNVTGEVAFGILPEASNPAAEPEIHD